MNENERNSQNFQSMNPVNPNVAMGGQVPSQAVNPAFQAVPAAPSQAMGPMMASPSQPIPSSSEQPIQAAPMNNFMDNFADAVVQKPEPVNIPVQQAPMTAPAQPIPTVQQVSTEPVVEQPIVQSQPVVEQPQVEIVQTNLAQDSQPAPVPLDPNIEAEVQQEVAVQENTTTSTTKKESHWKFILILFAIVGVAVLLFPFIVQIFGY